MSKVVKIKKGLNIPIKGEALKELKDMPQTNRFAIKPPDFKGLTLKLKAKQGTEIKAGDVVLYDKNNNNIVLVAPVSGTVVEVNRGERRRILEVVIETSDANEVIKHQVKAVNEYNRDEAVDMLQKSGMWPFVKMRPYGIVAKPVDTPRDIFVSCFDSSPLAPDLNFLLQDDKDHFKAGVEVLKKLTAGSVYLGINSENPGFFGDIEGVEKKYYKGPHPAGNVGVQIHHTKPVNKGEVVWTVNPQDITMIGKLFATGEVDFSRKIALTGSEIQKPAYFKAKVGIEMLPFYKDNITEGNLRYISGNVLTGSKILRTGFLGFYDYQVTVIPEGDEYEFLGWAMPRFKKYSNSRAYFSWLMPGKKYTMDANLNGGPRAFVMTGEYEKVFPMDILPVHLLKAILIDDIDQMENLGIYEVVEEDMALCEYVCTSKTDVQQILRQGIDLMIKETM